MMKMWLGQDQEKEVKECSEGSKNQRVEGKLGDSHSSVRHTTVPGWDTKLAQLPAAPGLNKSHLVLYFDLTVTGNLSNIYDNPFWRTFGNKSFPFLVIPKPSLFSWKMGIVSRNVEWFATYFYKNIAKLCNKLRRKMNAGEKTKLFTFDNGFSGIKLKKTKQKPIVTNHAFFFLIVWWGFVFVFCRFF